MSTEPFATLHDLRERQTLTVAEAASLLRIGKNTAYAAVHNGEIPSLKIGGRLLIPTARLLKLIDPDDGGQ